MARKDKYTYKDLEEQFPDEDTCLQFIFENLHSKDCSCGGVYTKVKGRKQYQCSKCRYQIAPMAGTIFHKSVTPLTDWFYALFIFSNAKSGISAKELERQLGCTYKCAWRMLKQIRTALEQDNDKLDGDVETDTGYFGGRFRSGKYNEKQKEAMAAKSVVMGAVSRGGEVRVKVVPDASAHTHATFLNENVSKEARLMTDGGTIYRNSAKGYNRQSVNHYKKEYVRGDVHVNNMEMFWGHMKRSIKGTHKTISKAYLQSYLDAFAFHYNNRHSDIDRFGVLLGTLLRVSR
jgi:transposase-like protein